MYVVMGLMLGYFCWVVFHSSIASWGLIGSLVDIACFVLTLVSPLLLVTPLLRVTPRATPCVRAPVGGGLDVSAAAVAVAHALFGL